MQLADVCSHQGSKMIFGTEALTAGDTLITALGAAGLGRRAASRQSGSCTGNRPGQSLRPQACDRGQASGTVYRLLFLEGELLDVLRRLVPRVTGDGRSTIGELVAAEDRRRMHTSGGAGLVLVSIDLDCLFRLENAGLTLDSALPIGRTVPVKLVMNQSGVADTETVRNRISPALVAEAAEAVRLVGLRLASVDVITPDPGRSLADAGGVILEVNGGRDFTSTTTSRTARARRLSQCRSCACCSRSNGWPYARSRTRSPTSRSATRAAA
jgi:hypothetical protein